MKTIKCMLTAVLLGCSALSFAQTSSDVEAWKGVRFSYDHMFVNYDGDNEDGDMNGFSVGYEHAFKVAKKAPLFIQTGAGLYFGRHKESDEGYELKTTALGLTIPVNVVYGVKINDMLTIKPYTGIYLKVNLMGKDKETEEYNGKKEEDKTNLFDKDEVGGEDYTWNRCQVGWQIGATLDINQFNVGIGYALDFNELAKETKTSKFAVTVGYNF